MNDPPSCITRHVVPEAGLERRFRQLLGDRYVTTDLTVTGFDDGAFDLVLFHKID